MIFKPSRKDGGLVEPLRPHWAPTAYVPGLGWHWARRRVAGRDKSSRPGFLGILRIKSGAGQREMRDTVQSKGGHLTLKFGSFELR